MSRLLDIRHALVTLRNEALAARDITGAGLLDDAIGALNQLPELKEQRLKAIEELARDWAAAEGEK